MDREPKDPIETEGAEMRSFNQESAVNFARHIIASCGYDPEQFTVEAAAPTADDPGHVLVFHAHAGVQQEYSFEDVDGDRWADRLAGDLDRGNYSKQK